MDYLTKLKISTVLALVGCGIVLAGMALVAPWFVWGLPFLLASVLLTPPNSGRRESN